MAKKGQKIKGRPEGSLIAIIADEVRRSALPIGPELAQDTVTGFLLAGVGNVDAKRKSNFLIVDNSCVSLRRPSRRGVRRI